MRNYLSEMLYALTSAYTRKDYDNRQRGLPVETNIGKLFSIFAWGLDSVQEQADLIRLWDDIDYARGKVLDRYGANFGVKRMTPDDDIYRLAIKVKVMAQLSGGDTDTVLRAASALLDVDIPELLLEDVYPAKIALYVDWELLSPVRKDLIENIAYAIKRILASGVGMRLYVRTYHTFRLELPISRISYGDAVLWGHPVSQDRLSQLDLNTKVGVTNRTNFSAPPVGEDRASLSSVLTARGAIQTPEVVITPPDASVAAVGRQAGAGGVIYHTHIKPKRID